MKKKGFTLIELLAVIIILGILMLIAIPSVTGYIDKSRKNVYVSNANELIKGVGIMINDGQLDLSDPNISYYIPVSAIPNEAGLSSPYGELEEGYVVVSYDEETDSYNYFWLSKDSADIGVDVLTSSEELDISDIVNNIKELSLNQLAPNTSIIRIFNPDDLSKYQDHIPDIDTLYNVVKKYYENGRNVKIFSGDHQDSMAGIGSEKIYYFTGSGDLKNNVIYNNICWRMFRTTDTGGVKVMYNGEADDENKCGTNRGFKDAISRADIIGVNGTKYYSDSYYYNEETMTYTLTGNIFSKWTDQYVSQSFADSIIGYYTCPNGTQTCSSLYYIESWLYNHYFNSIVRAPIIYDIIGNSNFNKKHKSLSNIGYMYNKEYDGDYRYAEDNSNYLYSNSVTYSNGKYTLVNPRVVSNLKTQENRQSISDAHYSCFTTSNECEEVHYIYMTSSGSDSTAYTIKLSNGEKIEDAINNMLYADDVNKYDSDIKKRIDAWYEEYMLGNDSKIGKTIFCNDRSFYDMVGLNPNSPAVHYPYIYFNNPWTNATYDSLKCSRVTDSFSISNPKAELQYSVGLLTAPEQYLNQYSDAYSRSEVFYTMTPNLYRNGNAIGLVSDGKQIGGYANITTDSWFALRPVVAFEEDVGYISGDGSPDNPYIVQ